MKLLLAIAMLLAAPVGAHVRVVQDHGTWWYEDGAGKKFFSLGACCIAGCYGHAEKEPLAPAVKARVVGWLKAWGFNTAAAWSSPSVYPEFYIADQIYTGFNTSYNPKEKREDVFDEAFWRDWLPGQVKGEVADLMKQPTLIGYFVDNEPHWNERSVLEFYLGLKPGAPGRQALVAFSRSFYGDDLRRLNQAWGTRVAAFGSLPAGNVVAHASPGLLKFATAWRNEVAGVYYARYIALVRAADPDHLILGIRWAGLPDLDLYRRVTPLCDVSSVNDYNRYGTLRDSYAKYYAAAPRPIMITEWSFSGFPEPGHRSLQFIDVGTQERRAGGYRKYVLAAARAPFMVGMHWFLYSDYDKQDEAAGGYLPDENMGLVTNDGATPYEALTRECARTNREVEAVHAAATWPAAKAPETPAPSQPLVRLTPRVDGDLSDWPATASATVFVSESLTPGLTVNHRYLLAADAANVYIGADIGDDRLDDPGEGWRWEGDALAVYSAPAESATPTGDAGDDASIYIYRAGGGKDHRHPFAAFWEDPVPGAVVFTRTRPGGFVLEAKVPRKALHLAKPGIRTIALNYRDVGGVYETWWDKRVAIK